MVYTKEKLHLKNGVKIVYMPSDVPENLDITGFEKHHGRVITCTRIHLMSGIIYPRSSVNIVHRAIVQLSNCSYFLPFFGVKISLT